MKDKQRSLLIRSKEFFFGRNRNVKILLFLLVGFSILGITSGTKVTSQDQELVKEKKFGDVPVRLVSISADKKDVGLEKPFAKTNDWFRGLAFELENPSDKSIVYLSLDLRFYRPDELKNSDGPDRYPFSMTVPYGKMEDLVSGKASGFEIKPAEKVNLPLKENYYRTLNESLTNLGYPAKFKGVEIIVKEVGFSDGTLWSYGIFYERNAENPDRWTPVQKKTKN
jgi:hypothetical protein